MTFEQLKTRVADKYPEAGNLIHILTVAFVEGYQLREREETMKQSYTTTPDIHEQALQDWSNVLFLSAMLIFFVCISALFIWAVSQDIDELIQITSELVR